MWYGSGGPANNCTPQRDRKKFYRCMVRAWRTNTYIRTHTYIHAYVRTYIHIYIHTDVRTPVRTHVFGDTCMHARRKDSKQNKKNIRTKKRSVFDSCPFAVKPLLKSYSNRQEYPTTLEQPPRMEKATVESAFGTPSQLETPAILNPF